MNLIALIKCKDPSLISSIIEEGKFGLKLAIPFNELGKCTKPKFTVKGSRFKRKRLVEIYGLNCAYCFKKIESKKNFTLDHVIPKIDGGSNRLSNLVICCYKCNNKKGGMGIVNFLLEKYDDNREGKLFKQRF